MDLEFSSSSSASELNLDVTPPEEPQVKYKVPYCPELRKENIVRILTPYKEIVDQIQSLLLWRWPAQLAIIFIYVNACALLAYYCNFSFINILIIFLFTFVMMAIIHEHKGVVSSFFFPPIPVDQDPNAPNRIYSLDEVAGLISTIGSRLYCFYHSCFQKCTHMSFIGQLSWISILLSMFVFFKIMKTFWIVLACTELILVVPGIIFNPNVYPKIKDNLTWTMMVISPKLKDE